MGLLTVLRCGVHYSSGLVTMSLCAVATKARWRNVSVTWCIGDCMVDVAPGSERTFTPHNDVKY